MTATAQGRRLQVPEAIQHIWEMEQKLGLHERTVAGVHYWPLFRADLFNSTGVDTGMGPLERAAHLARSEARALSSPSWLQRGAVETIVVPFHRKDTREGAVADRFLSGVLAEPRLGPFLALELMIAREWLDPTQDRAVSFLERGALQSTLKGLVQHPAILPEAAREHAALEAAWRAASGQRFPLSPSRMARRISRFKAWRAYLTAQFARTNAHRLFLTYHLPVVIAAAKAAGMQVIEVQHGAISRLSLQHHYPGRPKVAVFPDQLWTFGPFWEDSIELPANCRAAVMGSASIDGLRRRRRSKEPRSAIINSHLPNDGQLFEAAVEVARTKPDWTFVFRPHPQENFAAYGRRLAGTPHVANLRLSPPQEDVHDLLAAAEVQIGVSSTTLFEGMALGVRTIVLALPGAEVLATAIESGDAVLAQSPAELAAFLATAPEARAGERYFSPPLTGDEIVALMDWPPA